MGTDVSADVYLPIDVDEDGNLVYADGIEPVVIRTSDRSNFKRLL